MCVCNSIRLIGKATVPISVTMVSYILCTQSSMDSTSKDIDGCLPIEKKVAIVGIGCRFPGGIQNTQDFWETIQQGLDRVVSHPPERLDPSFIYPEERIPGKIYTAGAGYLSQDVHGFDREFFHE